MSLETREIKPFGRDIPGFRWDIPAMPRNGDAKSLREKKKISVQFWPLHLSHFLAANFGRQQRARPFVRVRYFGVLPTCLPFVEGYFSNHSKVEGHFGVNLVCPCITRGNLHIAWGLQGGR